MKIIAVEPKADQRSLASTRKPCLASRELRDSAVGYPHGEWGSGD